ncbi:hypothetical protein [Microvirga alba]|uniref:Uncharacterized protein n=1 Tax=Microvirga alba TaxID=2791025 RepID=A0A931BNW5_9HYPH|nr:hypothetical protein [Microvirga alba]MBF9234672.1 hypothetical protein [Microvirga alba]
MTVEEYDPIIRPFVSYHDGGFSLTYTDERGQVKAMKLPEIWVARLQLSMAEAFRVKAEERVKAGRPTGHSQAAD